MFACFFLFFQAEDVDLLRVRNKVAGGSPRRLESGCLDSGLSGCVSQIRAGVRPPVRVANQSLRVVNTTFFSCERQETEKDGEVWQQQPAREVGILGA